MKKGKRIFSLLMVFLMLFSTACTPAEQNPHVHEFNKQVASAEYLAGQATCEEKAKYYLSCSCGEKGTITFESGDLKEHEFVNGVCSCGEKEPEPPHEHIFDKKVINNEYLVSEATCKEKAKYYYSCECGEKGETSFEYGELAHHKYVNGVCKCGETEPATPHEHSYDKKVATTEYLASEATCKEKAKYHYSCSCGKKGENTFEYGDFKNHEYKDGFCECEAKDPNYNPSVDYSSLVDFVVNVPTGRDIKVLQLTDPQGVDYSQRRDSTSGSTAMFPADASEEYLDKYITQVVNSYKPDLIIMTGDLVYGKHDDNGSVLMHLIDLMETFEIPWAPVFGNHDNESKMGVDWQCEQLEKAEHCLFKQRTLTGNGNYTVGLVKGNKLQRVFFMMDSNGCSAMSTESKANGHYRTAIGFGNDQITWYTDTANNIKAQSPSTKLSFAFHIQINEFKNAMNKYVNYASYTKQIGYDLDTDATAKANGDFGYIGRVMKGPWDTDGKVWNSFKTLGVDSIFVGHEHCNSFNIEHEGVRFVYGQKSSAYDRHNKVDANGNVFGSDVYGEGERIIGGTAINLSAQDGSINGGGLVLFDESKYQPLTSMGVSENPDGSVSLAARTKAGAGYTSQMTPEIIGYYTSYLGFKGNYGFNTYIDITYTGRNLPNVLFFADEINGDVTSFGGKGIMIYGGIENNKGEGNGQDRLGIFGPNRLDAAYDGTGNLDSTKGYTNKTFGYMYGSDDSDMLVAPAIKYANYPLLTTKGQKEDTSGDTYKYTVGTFVNGNGYIVVDISLYNVTEGKMLYEIESVTTVKSTEVSVGSIVIYTAIKGGDEKTTFSYSAPYEK